MDDDDETGAWALDPTGRHEFRWREGFRWTDLVSDAENVTLDPYEPPATGPKTFRGTAASTDGSRTWSANPTSTQTVGGTGGFADAVSTCFSKYADFSGRASRAEYWWFTLFSFLAFFVTALVAGAAQEAALLTVLVLLALILPSTAVTVRRLHDTNRSGWWLLLGIVPFGGLVLLVFALTAGERSINDYGAPAL